MTYDFNAVSGNKNSSSKTLKRIEFEFNDKVFKFLLNPETYEQTETGRMNITHTKMGAYIETFGANIVEISISGTTGLKNNTSDSESGYRKFKELRDLIKSVYDNVEDGQEITKFLNFYNFTDNEYYVTYPDKFILSRSKSHPLLYKYSIHLYCIRRIGEPNKSVVTIDVANPLKVENTVMTTVGSSTPNTSTNRKPSPEVWKSYEDACADGYPNVKTAQEFSRGGEDKEKYGTYSEYLSHMYFKYMIDVRYE